MLGILAKALKQSDKDYTNIHPRHMDEHLHSLARVNDVAARELAIIYLEQIYCKYLSEDPINGSNFDIMVLDTLKKLKEATK